LSSFLSLHRLKIREYILVIYLSESTKYFGSLLLS